MSQLQPLLEVRNLEVHYKRRRSRQTLKATDGVSFEILPGTTLGLVGESGSGKSTIAKAILGMTPVHSGVIKLSGKDITNLDRRARRPLSRNLQVVFQDPNSSLNPYLTVGRTLAEPLQAQGEERGEKLRQRVAEALERVGLPHEAANRYPAQFSGGQRQRIAIARALMLHPELVICDEAVSALDLSVQAQILNLLLELQKGQGLSYLFISHDIAVVRFITERVVVLYQGQVMETGLTAAVTENPAHPYTRELVNSAPLPDPQAQRQRRAEEEKVRAASPKARAEVSGPTGQGCPFAGRCPYVREVCRATRPPLVKTENGGLTACHRYPEWKSSANPG
ncbi:MAG: ABC transporter ATP-binding protein [Chloroflexi bacterium]|nr:ABC transporter ATP-binding protein [Chloroflexota bacterium]OJV90139.1 MAG: peptide ABC transporter ATP-binding protein [Chloroflexi bacterium 54-19]